MSSRRQPQRHETAIAVGSADEIGRIAIRSGQRFVKRHPAISGAWVAGLLVSILASGYTPTPAAVQNYEVGPQLQLQFAGRKTEEINVHNQQHVLIPTRLPIVVPTLPGVLPYFVFTRPAFVAMMVCFTDEQLALERTFGATAPAQSIIKINYRPAAETLRG